MCFFSSRRRHTSSKRDWSSDVFSSDLSPAAPTSVRTKRAALPSAAAAALPALSSMRSEERRVGKECKSARSKRQEKRNETTQQEDDGKSHVGTTTGCESTHCMSAKIAT